jgi:LytS/YehU family sensor histidine kinase
MIRAYLDIEKLRLRDLLKVNYIVDESLLSLPLPPVLLLPLAERAILSEGGTPETPMAITVTVRRSADGLVQLEVGHTGRLDRSNAPFASGEEPGITRMRASLDRHYAGRYRFDLSQDSFLVRATLFLPLTA